MSHFNNDAAYLATITVEALEAGQRFPDADIAAVRTLAIKAGNAGLLGALEIYKHQIGAPTPVVSRDREIIAISTKSIIDFYGKPKAFDGVYPSAFFYFRTLANLSREGDKQAFDTLHHFKISPQDMALVDPEGVATPFCSARTSDLREPLLGHEKDKGRCPPCSIL